MDHDLPLTTTPQGTPERRMLGVLALAAAVTLSLTACSGIAGALGDRAGGGDDRTAAFDSGAAGKRAHGLPDWVPDDAEGVRALARPGGDEQILTMRADLTDLPATCTAVTAENPRAPHPEDPAVDPTDFRTVSTLRADWWPVEVEQDATVMCGRWWVTAEDGALYAFTPERRTVPVN
jgi:hypothetical protein